MLTGACVGREVDDRVSVTSLFGHDVVDALMSFVVVVCSWYTAMEV